MKSISGLNQFMNIVTVSIGVAAFLENMFIASNGVKIGWKLIKLNFRLF